MQRIEIDYHFSLPVDRVYDYLAEHENLGPLFGAKIARVRDGEASRNGVGSVRQLRIGILPPFEETIVEAVPNERIDYRITKGSPLRHHHGSMRFAPVGSGSKLNYVIEFGAVMPGLDRVIKPGLERSIRKGLGAIDAGG
jgi:uncharacterized protein YndB with AHSA1/START domain